MSETRIIQYDWFNTGRITWDPPMDEFIDHPFDLAFADPPYNYGAKYADDKTGDRVKEDDYWNWVEHVVFMLRHIVKDDGTVWWLCPAEQGLRFWTIAERMGYALLYGRPIIWHERFSQYQKRQLTADYRLLFPLKKMDHTEPYFNGDAIREKSVRQQMHDKRADPLGRVPGHVWQVRRLQGTAKDRVDWHPTQLAPEPLVRIVSGWTQPGQTVLDAFAGSGSMGLVCKRLGRDFVGLDRSAEYCKKMEERLA